MKISILTICFLLLCIEINSTFSWRRRRRRIRRAPCNPVNCRLEAGVFGVLAPIVVELVARRIARDRKLFPRSVVDNVHIIWWWRDRVTGVTAITAAPRIVADVVADWDTKEHVARKVSLHPEKILRIQAAKLWTNVSVWASWRS